MRALHAIALMLLVMLPASGAGEAQLRPWRAARDVRVATAPTMRPLLARADDGALPTLAHGYAELVARHSALHFLDIPYESTAAALAALCSNEADLVLVLGMGEQHLPCPNLAASRSFHGGATMLAGRTDSRLPRSLGELDGQRLAMVAGGPYVDWVGEHHPGVRLLPVADVHSALAAVESKVADAAIGLETTLQPIARRHFHGSVRLQTLDTHFSSELHLLARREDQPLLDRIERALLDITVEEHAMLLQRWGRQMLPESVEATLVKVRTGALAWLLPALLLAAAAPALWRRQQRRRADQRKDHARIVGIVSHEVRNAAQTAMASIELLNQSALPAGARELVAAASAATGAMRSVLNRSLELSRLVSGDFQPRPACCDLRQVCAQAMEAVGPAARSRGLQLQLSLDPVDPPSVWLDPDCLRQIVDNLLANALKFTDVGGVELRVQLKLPPERCELLLEVIDSGIGIAPTQLARLFEPYRQGDGGRARGGSGLGLSICRQLARLMEGSLDVHSVAGRGSRFILRLPTQPVRPEVLPCVEPAPQPLAGLAILLVEDHDLNRRIIAGQLQQLGAQVHAAADGSRAVALQADTSCPLVLLDIGLPDMTGYELAALLRDPSPEAGVSPRIFALSARSGRSHLEHCRRAGIEVTLDKPLHLPALLDALGLSTGQALPVAEDPALLAAAYQADIAAGLVQLQRAIADADAAGLRHHAHRLQGALQMSGGAQMAPMATRLWEVGSSAAPDWAEAQRLCDTLSDRHDARAADALPLC